MTLLDIAHRRRGGSHADIEPVTDRPHAPGEVNRSGLLRLPSATALVAGSIIGVGIFSLPYAVASYGPISLFAMGAATVGAVALAFMFAQLSKRLPASGGPYAYVRAAFGNGWGFSQAWLYWITAWAGNAAIAVGWVFYVEKFLNKGNATGWAIAIALAGLWIPAVVNLTGIKNMGVFQLWTTVLKYVPLVLMATVGLFFIKSANFHPWNASGSSSWSAIGGAMAICLFSYLGLETASVAAAEVRDPARNVPKATIFGTLSSAVVYLLSMIAVFGILPSTALARSANQASYSAATNAVVGGHWAGDLVAIAVIISGIGALNGWTLICAEMPMAAAKDGLFPQVFAKTSRRGALAVGIISSTALASIAMVISYLGSSGATVFTTLVLMTGITAAIPYGFSALAQLKWRWQERQGGSTARLVRDLGVAVVSLVMSGAFVYYSRNTGHSWYVTWGPFLMTAGAAVLGIPVYLAHRGALAAAAQPEVIEHDAVEDNR